MLEFIMILLFGNTALLTPHAVDIHGCADFELPKGSAKAITAGAHIQVQLSRLVVGEDLAISSRRRLISSLFPSGSVRAQLAATNGKIVDLDLQSTSLSAEDSRLSLSSTSGVPLNLRYSSVKVCSDVLIERAEVYWVNYSK